MKCHDDALNENANSWVLGTILEGKMTGVLFFKSDCDYVHKYLILSAEIIDCYQSWSFVVILYKMLLVRNLVGLPKVKFVKLVKIMCRIGQQSKLW